MFYSFFCPKWVARLLLSLVAILTSLTPLFAPLTALAFTENFVFLSSLQDVSPAQSVNLLNFFVTRDGSGDTLNSMALTLTNVANFAGTDLQYCFLIQDTNNPSADVFNVSQGDLEWRWNCGTPGSDVTYPLGTDLDTDGAGVDTTSTPGIAALPTSMTGRGSSEFVFGVKIAASPTNGAQFRLTHPSGAAFYTATVSGSASGYMHSSEQSAIQTILVPDTTPPTIPGGGPGNGQSFVPDQAQIDAVASEPLNSSTVTTSNVTLYSCTGATDASSCTTPVTSTNLCTAVTLTNTTQIGCTHATLTASTTYRFQVGTGVQDSAGNPLASAVTRIFRTSSVGAGTNTTPPRVNSTIPTQGTAFPASANLRLMFPLGPEGAMNFGTGTAGVAQAGDLNFCTGGACAVSLKRVIDSVPTTETCTDATACAVTWNSTTRVATVDPAAALSVSSTSSPAEYQLCVHGGAHALAVKNSANIGLPGDFCMRFTASSTDATPPTLAISSAVSPTNGATGVNRDFPQVSVRFSEALDPTTVSISTVRLCADSTSTTAGCESGDSRLTDTTKLTVSLNSSDNSVHIDPISATALTASTKYCIEIVGGASGVKDLTGNAFAATSSANCFTTGTGTSNSTNPKILFVDGDSFKVVVHFTDAMVQSGLITSGNVNTSNIALECPVGVTVPLTGKVATYHPIDRELEIQGLGLPVGQTCRITVTNATSMAGLGMDTASSNNVGNFSVLDPATTGGFLGGGAPASTDFFGGVTGQTAGTFWERPQRAEPRNKSANKATSVEVEFPAPGAMAVGSTILLSFPSGFTMSTADGTARLIPASQSFMNSDMNGPESGTITATAVADATAKTVTLTTVGATIALNQKIHFELDRVTTQTLPSDGLRISIIVKNDSGVKIGQTINPAPFNIKEGGSLSISGTVCKGTTSGGTCGGSDTAISGAKVFCEQMGGFSVSGSSASFVGHQEATTNGSGVWTITGLTSGQYNCGLPPDPTTLADTGGAPPFQSITLSSSNKTGADFKLKNLSGTAGKTLTVSITGGPASETLDVFCHAGASTFEFSAPSMKSLTLNSSGIGSTTLKLQQDASYECGVGPHVAFEQFSTGGPPSVPTFTFMPPKPQTVVMTADQSMTFALTATNRTITGTVVDGSSTGIANVFVHAEPVGCFDATSGAIKDCFGAFAQSKSDGTFTLNVSDGTYKVLAGGPGMPSSPEQIASVKGASVSGVTLKIVKSSTTISGAVQDESGNGIKYAHVSAEKRTIGSGSDACDFSNSTPAGGFADTPTDSSGNYTLYVGAGTWCLRAFSPSYGEVGNKTVTITTSSVTGQNIAATAGNYGTISGTVTKAGSNVSGAFINCFGTNGGNNAQSGTDGTYSLKVKLASSGSTSLTCDGFAPGIGQLGRATVTFASGETSKTQNFTLAGNPGTITVTATGLTEGFCDARDSSGVGSGDAIDSGTATIKAPAGTYTIRCGTKKTGPLTLIPSSVTLTAGGTAAVTATVPTLRTVTGRVTNGSSNLEGATAQFTETTTKASFVLVTGNQSGTNSNLSGSNVPEGTYNVRVSKQGYQPATTTAAISGGNFTFLSVIALTAASGSTGTSVTIAVQSGGSAYTSKANVVCTSGTNHIVAEVDSTTGNASVALTNGTWSCQAFADNGKQSAASNVIIAAGALSGSAPTLSLATSITGYSAKSDSNTFSLSSGGLLKFSDLIVGSAVPEITVPANSFSTTDSSTGTVEMKTDPTIIGIDPGADQNVVGSTAYDITPKDASGNKISDTNSPVTISIPYTDADVTAAGVDESKLTIASFDTSSQTWESLSTTVDTVNNLLIASITHFSSFGVLGGVGAPSTPSGLAATGDSLRVVLTWTQLTSTPLATGYNIYRSTTSGGTYSRIGSDPTVSSASTTTYTDTGLTASTEYFYKISAGNADGESSQSSAVSATTNAASSGGGGGSSGGGSAGGSSSSTTSTTTTTTTTTTTPTTSTTTSPTASTTPSSSTSTTTPSVLAPLASVLVKDPSVVATLLSELSLVRNTANEDKYRPLVKTDAQAFKVNLTAKQESAITNFVSYGISTATQKLGSGERRAVVRDYLDTVGRSDVKWSDVERITKGEKPIFRNLKKEQSQVDQAQKLFVKIEGHQPNFKNTKEDLLWNTLMYRIRFARDLKAESKAIAQFRSEFKHAPATPMDWAAVRGLAYVVNK
ncbi:Ig-like domain-containing protein [Candidatus Uhrbacteria bacterium]|nr:Ig-like domain-containing protein [Candidatus Uhrbacteria bacterium]